MCGSVQGVGSYECEYKLEQEPPLIRMVEHGYGRHLACDLDDGP